MSHGGLRRLPVVDGGKGVGTVSIRDLIRVAVDDRPPRGV
jgi:CBS domain-containing protein